MAHRVEFVRTLHGVSYFNDSKATNVDAALKGMSSFNKPLILIVGGHDKGTPLHDFMEYVKIHAKYIILIGESSERFYEEAKRAGIHTIEKAVNMEEAIKKAQNIATIGDVVMLSPACSSFDMYSCYEERGDIFKDIVNHLN